MISLNFLQKVREMLFSRKDHIPGMKERISELTRIKKVITRALNDGNLSH